MGAIQLATGSQWFLWRIGSPTGGDPKMFCRFNPAVSKQALNAMPATFRGLKLRKRTEVTLDNIPRERSSMVSEIAYYGR